MPTEVAPVVVRTAVYKCDGCNRQGGLAEIERCEVAHDNEKIFLELIAKSPNGSILGTFGHKHKPCLVKVRAEKDWFDLDVAGAGKDAQIHLRNVGYSFRLPRSAEDALEIKKIFLGKKMERLNKAGEKLLFKLSAIQEDRWAIRKELDELG